MPFPNRLTNLLGIDLPIIQAPMAGAATPELAAAVANAGGLGSLGVAMMTPDVLRETVAKTRALTNKPFNLNYFVHDEPTLDGFDETPMRAALAPLYKDFELGDVPPPKSPAPAFDAEALTLLLELAPKVVSFHFGLPDASAIKAIKEKGIIILGCATTAAEARALETLNAAYSKDREFYRVMRTLESYRKILNERTTLVLSTSSNLMKLLTEGVPDGPISEPQPTNSPDENTVEAPQTGSADDE